ncbi:MAG TPA: peptidoglycan synthetase [Flavobacteriales bacterium]|nr:peptidoglycan synthetase [Flavobacteriales bacterium]HIO68188.1 peptidoglycan synthetase [Flavobacteriales bacterium]
MNVHFIAIGGSAMHNLAIALSRKGYQVSGSDDEIFEPSKGRLEKQGILPAAIGWDVSSISEDLDAVVLGMHARADNPELLRAQELGLHICSYPEYLYEQTRDKQRVVIGGSHGKTTITAMILHVLQFHNIDCDYMVGAQLDGFDCMVRLTDEAPIALFEGDEYLSSPIDRRPKFHLYQPEIALLSGIAWDHINVFPTFEIYLEQFRIFMEEIPAMGALVYCEEDKDLRNLLDHTQLMAEAIPYGIPAHYIEDGITFLTSDGKDNTGLSIFGKHNLMNLNGARLVCEKLGVSNDSFLEAISSFRGASNRLELVKRSVHKIMFKDFAHSPSKVGATVTAVREQFLNHHLAACLELHTFSSLNEEFLMEYQGTMLKADEAIVYFNPHTIEHKRLEPITEGQVRSAFGGGNLKVFTDSGELTHYLGRFDHEKQVFLMMTSGNFDGVDFETLAEEVI